MPRIIKLRTVVTFDMEVMGDEYPTGPLSPADRKRLQQQIERNTREQTQQQPGVSVASVSLKRAFVVNG